MNHPWLEPAQFWIRATESPWEVEAPWPLPFPCFVPPPATAPGCAAGPNLSHKGFQNREVQQPPWGQPCAVPLPPLPPSSLFWQVLVDSVFHLGNLGVLLFLSFSNPVVVQSLSHVWLLATPRIAACQASLSFTISWSLLKPMSIELVMSSNHVTLCRLLLPPALMSRLFASGGQSIGTSASASVLPMNNQGWFPLEKPG